MKVPQKTMNNLIDWLRIRVREAGALGAVVGLSGGIDSAVTAALCEKAFPGKTLGLIMPCESQPQDIDDAIMVADVFQIPYKIIDLKDLYDQFLETVGDTGQNQAVTGNVKARLRMITLYHHANSAQYLVIGTGNRTELTLGYFTKYGDGGVDLLPLGALLKNEVYALAKELGIPERIINKAPSAGLWPGQTDERELGFSYAQLDAYVKGSETGQPQLDRFATKAAHKLRMPLIPPIEFLK